MSRQLDGSAWTYGRAGGLAAGFAEVMTPVRRPESTDAGVALPAPRAPRPEDLPSARLEAVFCQHPLPRRRPGFCELDGQTFTTHRAVHDAMPVRSVAWTPSRR